MSSVISDTWVWIFFGLLVLLIQLGAIRRLLRWGKEHRRETAVLVLISAVTVILGLYTLVLTPLTCVMVRELGEIGDGPRS